VVRSRGRTALHALDRDRPGGHRRARGGTAAAAGPAGPVRDGQRAARRPASRRLRRRACRGIRRDRGHHQLHQHRPIRGCSSPPDCWRAKRTSWA
jgi:hypothetical protein